MIPTDYGALESEFGVLIKATIRRASRVRRNDEIEDVYQHIWQSLLGARFLDCAHAHFANQGDRTALDGFQSYLCRSVRNHFKNLLRTRSRRHQERCLPDAIELDSLSSHSPQYEEGIDIARRVRGFVRVSGNADVVFVHAGESLRAQMRYALRLRGLTVRVAAVELGVNASTLANWLYQSSSRRVNETPTSLAVAKWLQTNPPGFKPAKTGARS